MPADNSEGLSHKELHALVAGARPDDISTRSDAVSVAARKIYTIVQDLERLVKKAEWEGESGEALRTWTKSFAKEGRALGDYATLVGSALFVASDGLSYAKKTMPDLKDGSQSEKDRQDALRVITRLNSYYSEAAKDVASPTRPNFSPLSGIEVPRPVGPIETSSTALNGQQTSTIAQSGAVVEGHERKQPESVSSSEEPKQRAQDPAGGELDRGVRTELDSATVSGPSRLPGSVLPGPIGADVPASAAPQTNVSPVAGISPVSSGGRSGVPASAFNPVPSQKPVTSPFGPGMTRTPATGIHGGTARPVSNGPSQAGMPRGTVIGGSSQGFGPASQSQATRRSLATEPGRAVGGRSGVVSSMPSNRSSSNVPGPAGPPLSGRSNTPKQNTEARRGAADGPGYLKESVETWNRNNKKTVPPVIGSDS
ncbi:hypothetical protein MTQ01_14420 [Streptomyces sp. XM4193]|uniref:hypothetical protein n=1 Tax=Streptomyces sp. XM4193 TaxID=2929782 RepID=UPI001FFA75C4|nr:hypothetical protein [Streptomyces sp. XM4193]MCK1797193.1 hypothetical protein [Streptomyces sp. XM4193]